MEQLPTLDAHCHISHQRAADELAGTGFALAGTLALDEAEYAIKHQHPQILWGVGCHPRFHKAQEDFNQNKFFELLQQTPIVSEVGLDTGSRVPLEVQTKIFREILELVAEHPRYTSIHSVAATRQVLDALKQTPIIAPVLHWWTGNVPETREAVALGCYFSIHSQIARNSKFRLHVPPERILVESDHGYNDPPAAIPCRLEWVEYLVGQQYKISNTAVRRFNWRNFGRIGELTGCLQMLPPAFLDAIEAARQALAGDEQPYQAQLPLN